MSTERLIPLPDEDSESYGAMSSSSPLIPVHDDTNSPHTTTANNPKEGSEPVPDTNQPDTTVTTEPSASERQIASLDKDPALYRAVAQSLFYEFDYSKFTSYSGKHVLVAQPSCYPLPSKYHFYAGPDLTAEPEPITCRACKASVVTKVETRVSMRTHLAAVSCCCMGGFLCLGWLPYCFKKYRAKHHYCPECDDYVGIAIEPPFIR